MKLDIQKQFKKFFDIWGSVYIFVFLINFKSPKNFVETKCDKDEVTLEKEWLQQTILDGLSDLLWETVGIVRLVALTLLHDEPF